MIDYSLIDVLPRIIVVIFLFYLLAKVLDFITGMLKTWKNGGYKSSIMRNGIIRWIGELAAITFVFALDYVLFYLTH